MSAENETAALSLDAQAAAGQTPTPAVGVEPSSTGAALPGVEEAGLRAALAIVEPLCTHWHSDGDADLTEFGRGSIGQARDIRDAMHARLAQPRPAAAGEGDTGPGQPVRISYINWRAEQTTPRILPQRMFWGSNEWHPEPGWLIEAVDLDKGAVRTYAARKILAWDVATPAPAAAQSPAAGVDLREGSFQARVKPWVVACFGDEVACDVLERQDRFVEEALELVQSLGYDRRRVAALTDYVFDREPGEPRQEIGGTMMTLAALCNAIRQDMHEAGESELVRVWGKVEKIRAKQAAKPKGSALPVALDAPSSDRGGVTAAKEGGLT